MKRTTGIVILVAVLLTSCQSSTVISTLEGVVSAAEIALPVIAAASGIPPNVVAAISKYLQAVDEAVMQASVILAGSGSAAQKSADIVQAFTGIAAGCNCIPPGTPTAVVSVIDAVAHAVARFLSNFTTVPVAGAPAPARAPTATKAPVVKVNQTDKQALDSIRARAEKHLAQVKALKAN